MRKVSILIITLFAVGTTLSSCFKDVFCISGEGDIITVELDVEDFKAIDAAGAFDIYISQGETQFVEAKGHENIIGRLETLVSGDTWEVQLENEFCYTDYELALYIQVPDISKITITGSSDIIIADFQDQESLDLNILGSGDVELNDFLGAKSFKIKISGSGDVECLGAFDQLDEFNIDITGSGNIDAYPANTDNCNIDISGSGNCKVFVNNKLDINISGSGDIYYKGNPGITTNISGSGDIYDEN